MGVILKIRGDYDSVDTISVHRVESSSVFSLVDWRLQRLKSQSDFQLLGGLTSSLN
jgi:hypothetical protein